MAKEHGRRGRKRKVQKCKNIPVVFSTGIAVLILIANVVSQFYKF
jgi:hypothetical protein